MVSIYWGFLASMDKAAKLPAEASEVSNNFYHHTINKKARNKDKDNKMDTAEKASGSQVLNAQHGLDMYTWDTSLRLTVV